MSSTDPQPGLRFLVKLSNRYGRHAVNAIIASEVCKAFWLNTTAQSERSGGKLSVLPRPLCSPHAPLFRWKLANSRSIPLLASLAPVQTPAVQPGCTNLGLGTLLHSRTNADDESHIGCSQSQARAYTNRA